MKPFVTPAVLTLALLCEPALAGEIEFAPARHRTMHNAPLPDADGGAAILFDDVLKTDWTALASEHFTAYPLSGLSPDQVAELATLSPFYDVAVSYPAPVTEDYHQARFVFLSAAGMRRLVVTGMRGIVLYGLSNDRKMVARVSHAGQVVGQLDPNDAPGGGFVAMLGVGQDLLSAEVVVGENPALAAVGALPGLGVAVQIEYRFSGDDSTYLFVRYEADDGCDYGCCQFIYKLFRQMPGGEALTPLQSSMYACDV